MIVTGWLETFIEISRTIVQKEERLSLVMMIKVE